VLIAKTYTTEDIATIRDDREHNRVSGKLVVSTGAEPGPRRHETAPSTAAAPRRLSPAAANVSPSHRECRRPE
jgi:hypothetical protein